MAETLGVAIVGAGMMGAVHSRASRLAGATLKGIAASSPQSAKEAAAHLAYFGHLLGYQHGLALRQDKHARHQLKVTATGQVSQQHQRLAKHIRVAIRRDPAAAVGPLCVPPGRSTRRINAKHMVTEHHMVETSGGDGIDPLGNVADGVTE